MKMKSSNDFSPTVKTRRKLQPAHVMITLNGFPFAVCHASEAQAKLKQLKRDWKPIH